MARGRMLSTTIAGDQRLNSLSIEAEYLFLKTVPHLDRDGLIYGKANLLWAKACPERMELLPRIDDLVAEWVQRSLVLRYDTADGPVLYFYGFRKNQTGIRYDREGASIFTPPPGYIRKDGKDGGLFTVEEAAAEPIQTDDEPDTDDKQSSAEPDTEQLPTDSGVTPELIPLKAKESKLNKNNITSAREQDVALKADGSRRRHVAQDEDFGRICKIYENEFGFLSPVASDQLSDMLDEYKSTQMILDAFDESIKSNKRSLRYVEGILRNWRAEGKNGRKDKANVNQAKPAAPTSEVTEDLMAFLEAQAHERFVAERNGTH